jgi:hypothetical protein
MKKIYYFLTPQGGDMWESVFQPQWHLYRMRNSEVIDDNLIEIIECAD